MTVPSPSPSSSSSSSAARRIPGFSAPAVGFDQPFEMLEACHERVQRTLDLLLRLQAHVQEQGADESARQAARDVLRYFDIAAPLHHEDEELHVFPVLLAQGPSETVALVRQLLEDHRAMEADWAAARRPLQALACGAAQGFDGDDRAVLNRFAQRYDRHIADEERIAYPAAQQILSSEVQGSMGREMASRRQAPAREGARG